MMTLFAQHGLEVVHAERVPLHHGQLRVTVQREGISPVHPSVSDLLSLEQTRQLDQFATYQKFADQTQKLKIALQDTLLSLHSQGKRIAGYGAPAKGNTLLSFLGLGFELVEYIADRSPLKQGRYTPGAHIPVVSPECLLLERPDYVLLLAWNFVEEVLAQQAEYRRRGGKFILPVPEIKII
jgi:hypothetical protein